MSMIIINQLRDINSLATLETAKEFYSEYETQYYKIYGFEEAECFQDDLHRTLLKFVSVKDIQKINKLSTLDNVTDDQKEYITNMQTVLLQCYETKLATEALSELQTLIYATRELLIKHTSKIINKTSSNYEIIMRTIGDTEDNAEWADEAINLAQLRLLVLTKSQQNRINVEEVAALLKSYESICTKQLFTPLKHLYHPQTFWKKLAFFIKNEINRIRVCLRKPLKPKYAVNLFNTAHIIHKDSKFYIKRIQKKWDEVVSLQANPVPNKTIILQ